MKKFDTFINEGLWNWIKNLFKKIFSGSHSNHNNYIVKNQWVVQSDDSLNTIDTTKFKQEKELLTQILDDLKTMGDVAFASKANAKIGDLFGQMIQDFNTFIENEIVNKQITADDLETDNDDSEEEQQTTDLTQVNPDTIENFVVGFNYGSTANNKSTTSDKLGNIKIGIGKSTNGGFKVTKNSAQTLFVIDDQLNLSINPSVNSMISESVGSDFHKIIGDIQGNDVAHLITLGDNMKKQENEDDDQYYDRIVDVLTNKKNTVFLGKVKKDFQANDQNIKIDVEYPIYIEGEQGTQQGQQEEISTDNIKGKNITFDNSDNKTNDKATSFDKFGSASFSIGRKSNGVIKLTEQDNQKLFDIDSNYNIKLNVNATQFVSESFTFFKPMRITEAKNNFQSTIIDIKGKDISPIVMIGDNLAKKDDESNSQWYQRIVDTVTNKPQTCFLGQIDKEFTNKDENNIVFKVIKPILLEGDQESQQSGGVPEEIQNKLDDKDYFYIGNSQDDSLTHFWRNRLAYDKLSKMDGFDKDSVNKVIEDKFKDTLGDMTNLFTMDVDNNDDFKQLFGQERVWLKGDEKLDDLHSEYSAIKELGLQDKFDKAFSEFLENGEGDEKKAKDLLGKFKGDKHEADDEVEEEPNQSNVDKIVKKMEGDSNLKKKINDLAEAINDTEFDENYIKNLNDNLDITDDEREALKEYLKDKVDKEKYDKFVEFIDKFKTVKESLKLPKSMKKFSTLYF